MYRFIVCVDVEAGTLEEAYRRLLQRMNANDWESSDEAYGPDGEPIPKSLLDAARLRVLDEEMAAQAANINKTREEIIEEVEPIWPNGCDHPQDSYLGTVYGHNLGGDPEAWDLYCFRNGDAFELCFRYGKEEHEYRSPGRLGSVVEGYRENPDAFDPMYGRALARVRRELGVQAANMLRARGTAEHDELFLALAAFVEALR